MLAHVDNRITYNGNGNATEFAYQFKILDRTDIKVLLTDADGKEKLLTKDYYVDVEKNVVRYPGYAVGAEVPESERPPVLPTGWKLTIYREVPVTQETDLPDQYPFNQVEDIGDKLTMIAQQLTDVTSRSLKISVSKSADIDATIPWESGKSFRISDDGAKIELTEDPARVLPLAQGVYAQTKEQAEFAKEQADASSEAAIAAKTSETNAKNYSENVNVFLPSVSDSGVLSWTNKAGLANPASVNIKGAKGDKGDTGNAATIEVGTVTTGAAGSSASVTNSGTASNVVLNFTLPRGKDGADGGVTVDEVLNATSLNPIANKTVYAALQEKVTAEEIANTYAKKADISGMVKSVNGKEPDAGGNVNVANMTGASDSAAGKAGLVPAPAAGMQNMALCGDATFKVLPIAGGGTGQTTVAGVRNILGLGNTGGALPIANGGTGASTAYDARRNLGVDIDVLLADATLLWQNPKPTSTFTTDSMVLSQPYTNYKRLLFIASKELNGYTYVSAAFINVDVLSANIELVRNNKWTYVTYMVGTGGSGIHGAVSDITTTKLHYSNQSTLRPQFIYGYK